MIVNEKALVRQMKDAYKNQGYTVAVRDDRMMITSGYWIVDIDMDDVPSEVLALIALHVRVIPDNDRAYKVVKGDDGPYVQSKLTTEAMAGLEQLDRELSDALQDGTYCTMKKTAIRMDGCSLWQGTTEKEIFLTDPRYEVLIESGAEVHRVGNGLYAEGNCSRLWVLRVAADGADLAAVRHLEAWRWVTA